MKSFLKDGLESFSYLIYALSLFLVVRRTREVKVKVLFFYYLVVAPVMVIACYTTHRYLNRSLYNCFFFATVTVFFYFFRSSLPSKNRRIQVTSIFFLNCLSFFAICVIKGQLFAINNYFYALVYISIIIFSIFYFENVLRNVNESNLLHRLDFWLVTGYFIYFFSCFFIIFLYDHVTIHLRSTLWSVQNVILFLTSLTTLLSILWIVRMKY